MRARWQTLTLVAVGTVLLAGCTSGGDDSSGDAAAPTTRPAPTAGPETSPTAKASGRRGVPPRVNPVSVPGLAEQRPAWRSAATGGRS